MASAMRGKALSAFACLFFAGFVLCFFYSFFRSLIEDVATLRSLSAADIRSVRLLRGACAQEHPVALPPDSWAELAAQLHHAQPTEDNGQRGEPSITLCAIEITTRDGRVLHLTLSTRPSLGGSQRLSIGGSTHHFEADELWRWLSGRPESKLQENQRLAGGSRFRS
jgi:hypothetical protein